MGVTIRDVARHAGVSVATVSRYLNNSPLIAMESVEKVRRSIQELHYEPNYMARNMLTHQSHTIAFAVDDSNSEILGNDSFLRIQYGIEHALAEHGYYLMIVSVSGDARNQNLRKVILEKRIDGIILPAQVAKKSLIQFLAEQNLPYVVIGRSDACSWVDIDNIMAGRIAAERLLRTGIQSLCFVGNGNEKVFVRERQEGFISAVKEAMPSREAVSLTCPASAESGVALIHQSVHLYDGYVVSDHVTAFGMLRALREQEINVPKTVQIVSFDDGIIPRLCVPALTVVDIDVQQLGTQAANMLYLRLQSETPLAQQCLIPVRLIERETGR